MLTAVKITVRCMVANSVILCASWACALHVPVGTANTCRHDCAHRYTAACGFMDIMKPAKWLWCAAGFGAVVEVV